MLSEKSKKNVLLSSINHYLSTVNFYETMICEEFGVKQANYSMNKSFPRVGTSRLLNPYYYSFHGIGCCILTKDPDTMEDEAIIDYDYNDDVSRRFYERFFIYFLKEHPTSIYKELGEEKGISKLVDGLVKDGKLLRSDFEGSEVLSLL